MCRDAKRRAAKVHRLLTARAGETFFLPSGVVALHRLPTPTDSDVGTEVAWRAYTGWHERVHFSQLVTSPVVCQHGWFVASIAREAARHRARGKDAPESLAALRATYDSANADFHKPGARGYTTLDVIEAQAVAQGVLRAFREDDWLAWIANHLYTEYQDAPHYMRVVNDAIRDLGGHAAAMTLLPRLCVVALQLAQPADVLAGMLDRIAKESAGDTLCAAGASGTWSWALRDPSLASRSLRERGMLNGRGWLELFNPIFDEFERFAPEDRLRLMMGESVGGVDPFYVFRPVIVYDDGTVVLPRGCPPDQVELENEMRDLWLSITTELIDGITILEHVADGPAAGL